jgi:hypothetical protein
VRAGLAQRAVDGSVVFAPPPEAPAAPEAGTPAPAPADPGPPPTVQRADAPAAAAGPAPAGPAPGGAAGLPAGADLDELARRLYGRIRLHLRDELRRDRERAGSLIDTGR